MVGQIERWLLGAILLVSAGAAGVWANATPARADHFPCHAPNRGWGFDTYEYEDYIGKYNQAIDIAVRGWAVPPPYTIGNETVDVSYQGVESGPRGARAAATPANGIPPSIYKAIAHIEANWANAASSVLYGATGPTLLSLDCGYGIGQITSGMGHLQAPPALDVRVPSARQAAIGTHPLYNIAEGVRILADKWNSAPQVRPVAGQGDPAALEDWYYAIWSYNGFAFSNHPLNPVKDPLRGSVWHCGDPNAPGYGFFERSDYTYTEDVYGCLRYPPVPGGNYPPPLPGSGSGGAPFDPNIAVGDVVHVTGTGGEGLNIRPSPSTSGDPLAIVPQGTALTVIGGPAQGSGLTWWNVQTAGGTSGWAAAQFLAKPQPEPDPDAPVNPAGRMWPPQVFSMPNLASEAVAAAFAPEHYFACGDEGFSGGCAAMDFATVPHYDNSPPGNPASAAYFLGDPIMQIIGDTNVVLTATATTSNASSPVTIKNLGTALAPFRVRTSADWVIVQHPGNPRHIDGGVAIGSNYEVLTSKVPRVATNGRDSVLQITADPRFLPAGTSTATVIIDLLLGNGAPVVFTVSVTSPGGSGGAPNPTPVPEPTPIPDQTPSFRAIVPNLTSEGSY